MATKDNPFISSVLTRTLLTSKESTKSTFHIELKIDPSVGYEPGDSIGIFPSNSEERVSHIISLLNADYQMVVTYRNQNYPLKEFFQKRCNIDDIPPKVLNTLIGGELLTKDQTKAHNLESLLTLFKPADFAAFIESLSPLLPRMYSIASSKALHQESLHLTVAAKSYEKQGKTYMGVGSQFLCYEAKEVPLYVHKSPHFKLPKDPLSDLIMIGPGTGIAPYKAFIEERLSMKAKGRHWLFFGERSASDYYYKDFWEEAQKKIDLEVTCAFSRDQAEKIYVQHRLLENKAKIWALLKKEAYLYLCGDATHMAKDVQAVLVQIAKEEGNLQEEEASHFFKALRKEGRFLLDVY